MSNVADQLFQQTQLAEAAYAEFDKYATTADALMNKGFSSAQAKAFVDDWQVITHQSNTSSGFSATLFQNRQTGEFVYAVRGTEPKIYGGADLAADIGDIVVDGLALDQTVDMYNDWLRVTTPKGLTYQAAVLTTQWVESGFYLAAKKLLQSGGGIVPGLGIPAALYLANLQARTDIVIDEPSGLIRKIEFKNSMEAFSDSSRQTGAGITVASLSVTGHSLGGHLASAFTRLFYEYGADCLTIDGVGFPTGFLPGLGLNAYTNIRNLFANLGGAAGFDATKMQNLFGSAATNFITMNSKYGLVQPGSLPREIFIESYSFGNTFGHYAGQMTDSLAVYDLFIRIDSALRDGILADTLYTLGQIFHAATDEPASFQNKLSSLETIVDALGELLVEGYLPLITRTSRILDDREALYDRIIKIRDAVDKAGNMTVVDLTVKPNADLVAAAESVDGIAWRYALKELNPFALTGGDSLYDKFNKGGELDLLDLESNKGSLSTEWIEDRAAMLSWMIKLNKEDIPTQISNPYSKDGAENIYFEDMTSGEKIYLGTIRGPSELRRHFIFGSDKGDPEITGANLDDRLYGMGGDDRLNGKGGNDHLEGGIGRDTYVFNNVMYGGRDGADTIVDRDGGYIYRGLESLDRGIGVAGNPNQWESADGDTLYIKNGKDLLIKFDNGDQITIKYFDFAAALTADLPSNLKYKTYGIELAPPSKVALVEGADKKHNVARENDLPVVSTAMQEGATKMFTVFVSEASDQDRILKIHLTADELASFSLGAEQHQYSFAFGSISVILKAGETSYTFALANTSDTDESGLLNLSAELIESGKDPIESNLATIDYTAVIEQEQTIIRTITDGDGESRAFNAGVDADTGNVDDTGCYDKVYFDMYGGNDLVVRGTSNDVVYAGGGNDAVTCINGNGNVQNGEQLVYGGDGDDWLENGGSGGKLYGEEGNDVLGQITWSSLFEAIELPENTTEKPVKADWANWDVIWHAVGATFKIKDFQGATKSGTDISFEGSNWREKEGNLVLTADTSFSDNSGSFLSKDGYLYYYTFTSNGSLGGTLTLDWMEGENAKHAVIHLSDTDSDMPTTPGKILMDGGEGDDLIVGAPGTNTLVGGAGNDLIQGGSGIDRAYGDGGPESGLSQINAGNDQIALGGGNDYGDGGDGEDIILGEDGADSLFGGAGDDYMVAGKWGGTTIDTGNGDYLDGEGDNDTLLGSTNDDTLLGGDGNDFLQGEWNPAGLGNDYLDGGDGNDILLGMGGNDILYGGADDDTLRGDDAVAADAHGNDELYGESGNDTLYGYGGNDLLDGGADDDQLYGGDGDDLLDGGSGNDSLVAQEGDDVLAGGKGRDQLQGGIGNDSYQFELGDSLAGLSDTIEDSIGQNVLRFGGGIRVEDIRIYASGGVASIWYSDNDAIAVQNGLGSIAWAEFADGSYYSIAELIGMNSDNPVVGTSGSGNTTQFGGKGNDKLTSTGQAIISGGKGSDILIGSGGDNTYLYSIGDGSDMLFDNGAGVSNRIRFGEGLRADDVRISYNESNVLTLQIGDKFGDFIRIQGFDPNQALTNPAIDFLEFADGTVLTYAELLEQGFDFNGTAVDDDLAGTSVNDRFNGGAGDDVLRGGAGDDVYYFNTGGGRDTVVDSQGFNQVMFGEGLSDDGLTVSQRIDASGRYIDLTFASGERLSVQNGELGQVQLFGFADGNWLSADELLSRLPSVDVLGTASNDNLTGYAGNDTLSGLAGMDTLFGGAGSDVLDGGQGDDVLRGGTGQDTYTLARLGGQDVLIESGTEANTIQLGAELSLGMVRWYQSGNNLVLSLRGSSDKLTLQEYFTDGGAKNWNIVAPGGDTMSVVELMNRPDPPTEVRINDMMDEFKESAWQKVMEENRDGGLTYQGDGKFYQLDVWTDHVFSVIDHSYSSYYVVESPDGTTVTVGQLVLKDQTIYPDFPPGSPIKGELFYAYNKQTEYSDAAEIVVEGSSTFSYEAAWVLVTFGLGAQTTTSESWLGYDFYRYYNVEARVIGLGAGSHFRESVDESSGTYQASMLASKRHLDEVYLKELTAGDGDNAISVETVATVDAGGGDDTIDGYLRDEYSRGGGFYYGNTGNDTIYGYEATLAGGDGDDQLASGNGWAYYGAEDEMRIEGCTFIGGNGNDVMLGNMNADRYIVLDKSEVGVKLIYDQGRDFEAYAQHYYKQFGFDFSRTEYPDSWALMIDERVDEHFETYEEFLSFREGLSKGDKWYWITKKTVEQLLGKGDLREPLPPLPSILAYDYRQIESLIRKGVIAPDVIELPKGVTQADLTFAWGKANYDGAARTAVNVSWGGELRMQIVMPTAASELGFGIEQFKLADGSILTMREALGELLATMPDSHVSYGTSSEDVMNGTVKRDVLYGLGGDDRLSGNGGRDTLISEDGDDQLFGGDDNDTLRAGNDNDILYGGAGDDVLIGGNGNDEMFGGEGRDSLKGGTGSDQLDGGLGNDIYFLRRGDGHDTILDKDSTVGNSDVASFASGIEVDQLWFRRVNDNLEVRVIGTSDKFTIQSWYKGAQYHVEQFRTADGQMLMDTQVAALVEAMAGFAPPKSGQTTLPQSYQDVLGGVIAANWQ